MSILMLSSSLSLADPSGLFLSCVPTESLLVLFSLTSRNMTCPSHCPVFYHSNNIWQERDARRITAADMKYVRKTAGYARTEYKTNTKTTKELNLTISFGKKYRRNWLQHINRRSIIDYLFTPWCRVLLEKLTGLQLVKKFPAFHGTQRFITALTSVRQLSLSWASPIQSIYPHPTSWRSVLILSTHLRLGLPIDY